MDEEEVDEEHERLVRELSGLPEPPLRLYQRHRPADEKKPDTTWNLGRHLDEKILKLYKYGYCLLDIIEVLANDYPEHAVRLCERKLRRAGKVKDTGVYLAVGRAVVAALRAGWDLGTVAYEVGRTVQQVERLLAHMRDVGEDVRYQLHEVHIPYPDQELMYTLAKQGVGVDDIAKRFETWPSVVIEVLQMEELLRDKQYDQYWAWTIGGGREAYIKAQERTHNAHLTIKRRKWRAQERAEKAKEEKK